MLRSSFHPLAERELVDAALYYERQCPGLGARFLDAAERCERAICEYPDAGSVIHDGVRRRLLRTFPYAFLYKVGPEGIRILAVMNLRRRPLYWSGRE